MVLSFHATGLKAQIPVSLELVLAVDTSESVDGFEFGLIKRGMAAAFRNEKVIRLIEVQNGVAIALYQWSSGIDRKYMVPWTVLRSGADCLTFAASLEDLERDPHRGFTAIGRALAFGVQILNENRYQGRRAKIDLSGDGQNNSGRSPDAAREAARLFGIEINGLPILTSTYEDSRELDAYFLEEVIVGPGAFVEIADDYSDFERAFLRKLIREITPLLAERPN